MVLSGTEILQATGATIEPSPGVVTLAPPPNLSIVLVGIVTSAGAITAGTGFSVVHNGTGDYTVTFTAAFSAVPVVVVTGIGTTQPAESVWMVSALAGSVRILSFTTAGSPVDDPFNFIAYQVS